MRMTQSTISGTWRLVLSQEVAESKTLPRSSHIACAVSKTLYVAFGELKPRLPVSNKMFIIDKTLNVQCVGQYEVESGPAPRVGAAAAAIGSKIYVFGGRGGKSMTALEESGVVHIFDTTMEVREKSWKPLTPSSDVFPDARSFHCATAVLEPELGPDEGTFYIHAGCLSAGGRTGDLWSFTPAIQEWQRLEDAPGPERGGTSLVASLKGDKLYRFGGFDGKNEIGGALDIYDIALNEWTTVSYREGEGPGYRSVTGLLPIVHDGKELLVLLLGERDASSLGHDGAGMFWNDIWTYDVTDEVWAVVKVEGERPAARGWFGSGVSDSELLIMGGLTGKNERLGDCWALTLTS